VAASAVPTWGLVLTGGGARAAYQVGALRALADLTASGPHPLNPFRVIAAVSAGSVNGTAIAARANDFPRAVRELWALWSTLTPDTIYRTDPRSLSSIGTGWLRDLSLGGLLGARGINHLLDTAPLRRLLSARLEDERIAERIADGSLRGVACTATNYATGTAVTFFDGVPEILPWQRSTRIGVRSHIGVDHVMASSAIPIFFPPVRLAGTWYGDGCVRMSAPIGPAIHLGADRVVAIGIRYQRTDIEALQINLREHDDEPVLSDIAGVLLNAVFLDALEADLERVQRINRTLALIPPGQAVHQPLRSVPVLALRPSEDLGRLAAQQYDRFPRTLRYFLSGIGATGRSGWDLVSYLAFEPVYIKRLLDLGYRDTMRRADEVRVFCAAAPA
jgi:NTE family protein